MCTYNLRSGNKRKGIGDFWEVKPGLTGMIYGSRHARTHALGRGMEEEERRTRSRELRAWQSCTYKIFIGSQICTYTPRKDKERKELDVLDGWKRGLTRCDIELAAAQKERFELWGWGR
jgi:hypothetical protein